MSKLRLTAEKNEIEWRFWREQPRRQVFAKDARKNLLFLGKWLTLAFVLESLMLAYVPAAWIADFVGEGGWLPVISATLVGVPLFVDEPSRLAPGISRISDKLALLPQSVRRPRSQVKDDF